MSDHRWIFFSFLLSCCPSLNAPQISVSQSEWRFIYRQDINTPLLTSHLASVSVLLVTSDHYGDGSVTTAAGSQEETAAETSWKSIPVSPSHKRGQRVSVTTHASHCHGHPRFIRKTCELFRLVTNLWWIDFGWFESGQIKNLCSHLVTYVL